MSTSQWLTTEQLALQMGRDAREIAKLADKGKIPGRRVDGEWQFQSNEIREWIEGDLANYSSDQLTALEQSQQSPESCDEFPVSSLMKPELIEIPLQARTKRSTLNRLVEVAGQSWQVWSPDLVLKAVMEREDVMSTAMEGGVAVPHPRNPLPDAIGESLVAFGRTGNGVPFGGSRQMTDLFFLVLCRDSRTHLQVLARLGRLFLISGFLDSLREADTAEELWQTVADAEESLP